MWYMILPFLGLFLVIPFGHEKPFTQSARPDMRLGMPGTTCGSSRLRL
jgi:hypothetical protein